MSLKTLGSNQNWLKTWIAPTVTMVILTAASIIVNDNANGYVQLILLYACANIILALSLNLVNGFTGQFSIGHAGFMAVGAYTSAFLSTKPDLFGMHLTFFPAPLDNLNYFIFAIAGGLTAALAGWFVGLPSLRLRGDYLAIVTLGFGEIIRVMFLNMPAVGGARGLFGIPRPGAMSLGFMTLSSFEASFLFSSFWVMVTFVVLWRLVHSTHGRAFLSVREDEIAAQSMGINTTQVKVRAFVISSFFAGIAGSIFAHSAQYLNPSTFTFTKSVDVIIMIVLGGMGSLTGSVFAAVVVTFLPEFVLRPLQEITKIDFRMVIYSLTLILFMIARPAGIFGTREWPDLWCYLRNKTRRAFGRSRNAT
jgi:branched-chain amino acid transport system permease protein